MQSFVDDIRLAEPLLLDNQLNVIDSLIQFLAFVLGDYCLVYNKEEYKSSVFHTYYSESFKEQENSIKD